MRVLHRICAQFENDKQNEQQTVAVIVRRRLSARLVHISKHGVRVVERHMATGDRRGSSDGSPSRQSGEPTWLVAGIMHCRVFEMHPAHFERTLRQRRKSHARAFSITSNPVSKNGSCPVDKGALVYVAMRSNISLHVKPTAGRKFGTTHCCDSGQYVFIN